MRTGMSVRSPYPMIRSSIRMSGNISGGGFITRSFSRATSTPSSTVNSSGTASRSALRMGSISGRVMEVSVMCLRLARDGAPTTPAQRHRWPQAPRPRSRGSRAPASRRCAPPPALPRPPAVRRSGHRRRASGSYPATAMYAGGRPEKSAARPGAKVAGGFFRSWPRAYHRENSATASSARIGASAFSVNDGSEVSQVVAGYHRSWKAIGGPSVSRASCVTTAARLPPAESPATARRFGSAPSWSACWATHCVAAHTSSTAAGYGCSGARR